jgi:hypothetical protein
MKRVTAIGGVFFKAADPQALDACYEKHLGLKGKPGEGIVFRWSEPGEAGQGGTTVFAIFPKDTTYAQPSEDGFMINFRVEDLDSLLEALRAEGIQIDPKREYCE